MMRLFIALAVLAACNNDKPAHAPPASKDIARAAPDLESPAGSHPETFPLPWIHDDLGEAMKQAQARGNPLVIDFWAPWCHTCLSMKHTVLRDPSLSALADRFVWLMVNTDLERNAPITEKYPVRSWPTYVVVSPTDETVVARQVGGAAIQEFREFLLSGERASLAAAGKAQLGAGEEAALAGAKAMTHGEYSKALAHYSHAIAIEEGRTSKAMVHDSYTIDVGEADRPRRDQFAVAIMRGLYLAKKWKACANHGNHYERAVSAARNVRSADLQNYLYECADKLSAAERAAVHKAMGASGSPLQTLANDSGAQLTVDDRSDVLGLLYRVHKSTGNADAASATATRRTALLDDAARASKTAYERMTYSWPRTEAHMQAGTLKSILPDLERAVVDLPREYDPPYRLAFAYLRLNHPERALPMAQAADELVTGARRARVQGLIADIHLALENRTGELAARRAVVEIYKSQPSSSRNTKSLTNAVAALDKLEATTAKQPPHR